MADSLNTATLPETEVDVHPTDAIGVALARANDQTNAYHVVRNVRTRADSIGTWGSGAHCAIARRTLAVCCNWWV